MVWTRTLEKETLTMKHSKATDGFHGLLRTLKDALEAGPRPGPSSVGASLKTGSSYAPIVASIKVTFLYTNKSTLGRN